MIQEDTVETLSLRTRGVHNTGIPMGPMHGSHGNPMGMGIARLVSQEWKWEWERLDGNGRE